jgi:hydroxymethylglutaryl-CoA reductase (NADPH)
MSKEFIIWFRVNFSKIKEVSSTTTKFGKLHSYKTFLFGRVVYVRLEFSSGDAMGMNMVTRATGEICNYVKNNYEIVRYVIESNLSVDKKPSYMNMIMGRGKSISAEVRIPSAIVRRFLLTTPSKIVEDLHIGTLGSILSGTIGANYHFANGIAALFLACGQDVANVSESCAGILNMEVIEHDLYVSIFLPSLIVATIGGGTGLPSQNACLAMLGCCGMNKVKKFAEIAAATILAGEISLAAAITAGDFIDAHEKYGRNRPAGDQSRMK